TVCSDQRKRIARDLQADGHGGHRRGAVVDRLAVLWEDAARLSGRPSLRRAAVGFSELQSKIVAFRNCMLSVHGMADITVQSYGRDVDRFDKCVVLIRLRAYHKPTLKDHASYVGFLHDEQLAPPSIARHLVSLKMFYRFLKMEERADATAVDLLGSPK